MLRLFRFKTTDTTYARLRDSRKWYLSYSNEAVYVNKPLKFKDLEAHKNHEELV